MLRILIFIFALLFATPVSAQEAPAPPDPEQGTPSASDQAAEDQAAEDAQTELQARVRNILSRIPELRSVTIETGEGVVTLSGEVPTADKREAAAELAAKVEGVLWVDNRVAVAADAKAEADPSAVDAAIREQLEGVFANVPDLQDVDVSVHSGVVRLTGEVLSEKTRTKAGELAGTLDGVVYVDNSLEEVREVQKRISPALQRAREVATQFVATLPLFAVGILILVIFFFLGRAATAVALPYRGLTTKPLVLGIVRQVVRVIVFAAGILLVLELFNLTALVGAVLGTAGVAGLAIGFAFRDIVENYLASIMLSLRQPFDKNDVVCIDVHEGKVVRLSTRETVLMTLDGNHLRIPNAIVFKSVIYNFTRNPLRRYDFTVGVGVDEDLVSTLKIGVEAVRRARGVIAEPQSFGVIEALADSSVNLRFYAWFDQREIDLLAAKSAGMRHVKEAFSAAGIEMPEPTTRVLQAVWEPVPKSPPVVSVSDPPELDEPATDQLDAQIATERALSDEEDLLR